MAHTSSSSMRPQFLYPFLLTIIFALSLLKTTHSIPNGQEADRVTSLPGQPNSPPLTQFSGYITVNKENGRALFYWFFEAQTQPTKRPLLLWLTGGPGCSSVGYGAASELGPLRVNENGTGLEFNKFAWNKEANLIFLESPVGVGFSYTNTSSDLTKLDDGFVAEDSYNFLVNWMKRFPQYQSHDFYIVGESYGGHYVPQLAELVYDRNNKDSKAYDHQHVNLKGFMVGNPITDYYYDNNGLVQYAWSHSVISDQVYEHVNKVCDFKLFDWSNECNDAMNFIYNQYNEIDIYNIYAPKCLARTSPSSVNVVDDAKFANAKEQFMRIRMFAGYDPCFVNHAQVYFNNPNVQRSLHANVSGMIHYKWQVCSDPILDSYNFSVFSVLPIYSKLIKAGLRVWLYSGDADGRVPVIGSRHCMEALGLPVKAAYESWYLNKQVAGRFVDYQGLTMATIRGAGHLVPINKPAEALVLLKTFLLGGRLPTDR